MMQATSDQKLTTIDAPGGKQYVIQIPTVTPAGGASMVDLYQARVVIDGNDFGIRELEASGTMFKQPYNVSFKLIRRAVRPAADVPGGGVRDSGRPRRRGDQGRGDQRSDLRRPRDRPAGARPPQGRLTWTLPRFASTG